MLGTKAEFQGQLALTSRSRRAPRGKTGEGKVAEAGAEQDRFPKLLTSRRHYKCLSLTFPASFHLSNLCDSGQQPSHPRSWPLLDFLLAPRAVETSFASLNFLPGRLEAWESTAFAVSLIASVTGGLSNHLSVCPGLNSVGYFSFFPPL